MTENETESAQGATVADDQDMKPTAPEMHEPARGESAVADAGSAREGAAADEGPARDAGESESPQKAERAEGSSSSSGSQSTSIKTIVMVIAVVAALLLGLLGGSIFFGGTSTSNPLTGKTSVSESELESAIAAYTIDGKTETLTVKEVIEQTSSLAAAQNADGSYAIPSADSALSAARNRLLAADAEARGITVSDDEVADYAQQQIGASDYSSVEQNYGMDSESMTRVLRDTALMSKLRESIVGDSGTDADLPDPPAEPSTLKPSTSSRAANNEDANSEDEEDYDSDDRYARDEEDFVDRDNDGYPDEDEYADEDENEDEDANSNRRGSSSSSASSSNSTPHKEYADYVIALAGDEWDKAKGTWASTGGPYHQALASYQITPEGATYEAAIAAYYVAYQLYSERATEMTERWNDYVNGLLSKANITIYSLVS